MTIPYLDPIQSVGLARQIRGDIEAETSILGRGGEVVLSTSLAAEPQQAIDRLVTTVRKARSVIHHEYCDPADHRWEQCRDLPIADG